MKTVAVKDPWKTVRGVLPLELRRELQATKERVGATSWHELVSIALRTLKEICWTRGVGGALYVDYGSGLQEFALSFESKPLPDQATPGPGLKIIDPSSS